MGSTPLDPDQIISMIAPAPGRIAEVTADLSSEQLAAEPAPGEWSVNAILAHLRACADVWGDAIATILAEDHPTIRAVNPRTWMAGTDYLQQEFSAALFAYTAQREALVGVLTTLPAEAWMRGATVKGAGRTLERTVLTYAESIALHERAHLKQIARAAQALIGRPAR